MPKNPYYRRQLKLIEILEESADAMTQDALAKRLGVGEKTIKRDFKKLEEIIEKLNLPIKMKSATEAHGRKVWSIEKNPHTPTPLRFMEAAALYLGHRFLEPLTNSFLWEAAQSGLRRIRDQLGSDSVRILDRLMESFCESTTGWSDYSQQAEVIETLIFACEEHQETVIRYRSLSAMDDNRYTIHPYALVMQGGTFYVVGVHCKHNDIRTWKLNRIVEAETLQKTFEKRKDFDIARYRRRSFGVFVFNNEPVQKVRIKVDGVMARYVQEHRWHETQQFEPQPDGGVIVQFEVVPNNELINWILKLGHGAEVLEPASLRREIETEIAAMLKRYKK